MANTETPPPATPHTVTPDAVTDAVTAEVVELYRVGVSRAQAVDSLHSVANELIQPLITPTPGPAQRSALACADALRAAPPASPITTMTPAGGHPPNSNTTTTPRTKPPNPRPLPPRRHPPPEHRHCPPTYRHRRQPTHRHRCRSTHRASTCRNTCGHPCHRNTPAAPECRT